MTPTRLADREPTSPLQGEGVHSYRGKRHPIIHVEHDAVLEAAVGFHAGEVGARAILHGEGAELQRAHVALPGQLGFAGDLAPGIDGVAGERGCGVTRAVQAEHVEGVGESVEAQAPRDRDDVAAIDEAAAEPGLALDVLIEMHARGVLEQTGGELMLGFLDGLAVDMIDLLADCVILPAALRARERIVVNFEIELGQCRAELLRIDGRRKLRHHRFGRRRILVALVHHHPARIAQHRLAMLIASGGAHIDRAALLVGVLLQPDHLGGRGDGVAGIDRLQETELGIAEIGDGIARNIGNGLADHHVEHEQIVDRRLRVADRFGEGVRGLHGEARAIERGEQADIAHRHGARRGVDDVLAEAEILEIIADDGAAVGGSVVDHGVANFNPMMEAIRVAMKNSRKAVAGSL